MIEQIKSLYGQAFIDETSHIQNLEAFFWFKTEAGVPFGVRKSAVTDKEYQLLCLSFQAINLPPKHFTHEEHKWSAYLFQGDPIDIDLSTDTPRYLLHIYFKLPFKEIDTFREAVLALFDEVPIILWRNDQTVLLILQSRPETSKTEEFAQLLATDFYSDVTLFVGTALNESSKGKHIYELEEKTFKMARKCFPEKRSFIFEKAIPLLLLSLTSHDVLTSSFSSILTVLNEEDPEWITSLLAFFEHGMNITAASKALFIHRNSLQYRLEKFTEKTGLDPKQFTDALYIYLALLTKKLK